MTFCATRVWGHGFFEGKRRLVPEIFVFEIRGDFADSGNAQVAQTKGKTFVRMVRLLGERSSIGLRGDAMGWLRGLYFVEPFRFQATPSWGLAACKVAKGGHGLWGSTQKVMKSVVIQVK
jgi:hypothetical protein